MPADSLQDLLDRLRAYCAQVVPGEIPLDLRVTFVSGRKLQHPVPVAIVQPARQLAPARHSIDFRSVHWHGTDYAFSPTQAACVKVLWEAWEDGIPDVGQATILETAGSATERLRALFIDHPAWGSMIVVGNGRGTYRLCSP